MKEPTIPNGRGTLCVICKNPSKPLTDGEFQAEEIQHTSEGPAHADCYYQKLGEGIEEHPICSPRFCNG